MDGPTQACSSGVGSAVVVVEVVDVHLATEGREIWHPPTQTCGLLVSIASHGHARATSYRPSVTGTYLHTNMLPLIFELSHIVHTDMCSYRSTLTFACKPDMRASPGQPQLASAAVHVPTAPAIRTDIQRAPTAII
jgi:hypothetical protein